MRRALATALITMATPATAVAAKPYRNHELTPTPVLDKAFVAHQRAQKARRLHQRVQEARRLRERAQKARRARAAAAAAEPAAIPGYLAAIAACESGGNPAAIGGGGLYRGLFQMTIATWRSVGGQGDPAAASVAEQVRRAAALYAQAGPGQWPVCAR
jgi:hypothetical protein